MHTATALSSRVLIKKFPRSTTYVTVAITTTAKQTSIILTPVIITPNGEDLSLLTIQ